MRRVKIILFLFVVGLHLSIVLWAAENKITVNISIGPWQRLMQLHQKYYLGNKTPNQEVPFQITDDGFTGVNHGELFWQYINNIFRPLARPIDKEFINVLEKADKWLTEQPTKIKPLLAQVKACRAESAKLEKILKENSIPVVFNKEDLVKQLSNKPDEISNALTNLMENMSDKNRALLYLSELKIILNRIEDIDNWAVLESGWVSENIKMCAEYTKSNPGNYQLGYNMVGSDGITLPHKDFAEFQRQMEDMFCLIPSEPSFIGADEGGEDYLAVARLERPFYKTLKEGLKKSPRIANALKKGLMNPYDLTYLNCIFYKYNGQRIENRLIEVMKNWEKVTPESENDTISLLEVINSRQGSFWTSENPKDRFEPHLLECLSKVEGANRAEVFANAHKIASALISPMQYGINPSTMEAVFKNKQYDCTNACNMFAYILANAGYGGSYALRTMPGHHWTNSFWTDNKFDARDAMNPSGSNTFPAGWNGDGIISRYIHTVNAGIEGEIYFISKKELHRREVPYYHQAAEVLKID
jgi:hypothetical protein